MYRIAATRSSVSLQRSLCRASGLLATVVLVQGSSRSRYASSEPNKKKDDDEEEPVFDLSKEWERATTEGADYFKKWIITDSSKETQQPEDSTNNDETAAESFKLPDFLENVISSARSKASTSKAAADDFSWTSIIKDVTSVISGSDQKKEQALKDLIETTRSSAGQGDIQDSTSFAGVLDLLERHHQRLEKNMEDTFGHIEFSGLAFAASLDYYLEKEDSVKNPSWKRRMHRFHRGIDVEQVKELNAALYLAELCYAHTVEEIQAGLENTKTPCELVFCDVVSAPGEPAHFILLEKDQSVWSSSLQVTMVVRGTRDISDALTDAFLETADYRDGKAHAGILDSGQYLVKKHTALLEKMCKLANKRKVRLTLIGHSLGAGAASIAGIEFNENPMIDAQVVGFGCPSFLTRELSERTASFIHTVIADDDMIPRMNGATIANSLLDIMEYDWTPEARRDYVHALDELQRVAPGLLSESAIEQIISTLDSLLESYARPTIKQPTAERAECILYPPGTCYHFYRDGNGISGSQTPCTFFHEIDVTRRMIDDHLIDTGYRRIFLDLMRQVHRDHHFSFEDEQ